MIPWPPSHATQVQALVEDRMLVVKLVARADEWVKTNW
jgi:hypothetical protein